MFPKVFGIFQRLLPVRRAAPVVEAGEHVGAVAHTEKERAAVAVGIFVQLSRRMHHERAWQNVVGLRWGTHGAATRKAEVDLRRLWMAMIRAHLPRLPTSYGDVAASDRTQYLLDVAL